MGNIHHRAIIGSPIASSFRLTVCVGTVHAATSHDDAAQGMPPLPTLLTPWRNSGGDW